jgi:hypothetical protein
MTITKPLANSLSIHATMAAVSGHLLNIQNVDGGWGAAYGKRSNTEATSLVLLGLSTQNEASLVSTVNQGLAWLTTRQRADGSWPLTDQLDEGSWATALSILALSRFASHLQRALRGAAWLLRQKGQRLGWWASLLYGWAPQKFPYRLNPDVQGWTWTPGTFSWVEPTAYALLALKQLRAFLPAAEVAERLYQGERLLYDRMCVGGGWNYGNAQVLGEDVPPYPEITALALIALQNHQAREANQVSLTALRKMLSQVNSGLTLSWASLCFALYGHDVLSWQTRLVQGYERTEFLGDTRSLALALLALGGGANVLQV